MDELPIEAIRRDLQESLALGPVIITAPTGTGKSTQVPRWLLSPDVGNLKEGGFILVVQPRRVASRAVAARIAELEGKTLGDEVGYRVRDDDRSSAITQLLVVTPGVVLSVPSLLDRARTVIIDELHERRLDTDLIFALLSQKKAHFVAMSATLDGQAVAQQISAKHLSVQVRKYPVEVRHFDAGAALPDPQNLERNVLSAVNELKGSEGDILVFLPGKAEIQKVAVALESLPLEVVLLHGSLALKEQARVLRPNHKGQRRVIVTTNVAETSLTIPSVRAVIDSGLVRQTTTYNGRSYLSLSHIAVDSADQRAGRAGRTAPGECIRLWGRRARLKTTTSPEIHRESLIPLVMTCAALGHAVEKLPFLDAPKGHALKDARLRLEELKALVPGGASEADQLTEIGRKLRSFPLDAWLSRVLVQARKDGCLNDAIDLVAALDQPHASKLSTSVDDDELDSNRCDLLALIHGVRSLQISGLVGPTLKEARNTAKKLRAALGVPPPDAADSVDRSALLRCLLRADPACAYVARVRKTKVVFSNGGTEMELGRNSRAHRLIPSDTPHNEKTDALVVLETRGVAVGNQARKLIITLASPVPLKLLSRAELGDREVKDARIEKKGAHKGVLFVSVERTYAGRVIEVTDERPAGELARQAIVKLFERGSLHPKMKAEAIRRLSRLALAAKLGTNPDYPFFNACQPPPSLSEWLATALEVLGVESGEDLALLDPHDFLPPPLAAELSPQLDENFPLEIDLGDCLYHADYNLERKQVTLSIIRGHRKKPPPANYLPRFDGFRVFAEAGGCFHQLRR